VLVALVVVALGMSALLETLTQSAQNVSDLRERTVAEWIAMNQLALVRLNLNAPAIGVTQGDVQNCANGNWHWQESISPVTAIPGLMSITVRVRRTGNATNGAKPSNSANAASAGPGGFRQLGPNISLGPTAALGSVTSLSTAGCASLVTAGSSLGPGAAGSPGQTSQSLGAAGQLGASSGLAGPSLGSGGSGGTDDSSVEGPANAFGGLALGAGAGSGGGSNSGSGNSSSGGSSGGGSSSGGSSGNAQWLVTLTGFRGNTLGASVGETPDWAGSQFAGQAGPNGIPSGNAGGTPPGNSGFGRFPQ
jgi:type II secretion system protein I